MTNFEFAAEIKNLVGLISDKDDNIQTLADFANTLRERAENLTHQQRQFGCFMEEVAAKVSRIIDLKQTSGGAGCNYGVLSVKHELQEHIDYLLKGVPGKRP